jgi:hypothetical protein
MIKLTRHILPVLLVVSLIAGSCAGRKNKAASNDLIPENDLISILKDVYLTDGLLSLPDINRIYQANTDSLSAYSDVVESHGYKLDQMNRTIRYYFVKKPKKLIKIYDKVLGLISEMDSRIEKEAPVFAGEPGNFWSGKSSYSFPDPSGKSNAFFDYPVPVSGIYVMKFTLTVYPDDQAVKPRIGIFIYNPDSTGYTNRKYFHSVGFIKDGRPHTYRSTVIIRNPRNRHSIKGWFIENENIKPPAEDHMRVENIKLSRNPVE